jgi:hypothetical protein
MQGEREMERWRKRERKNRAKRETNTFILLYNRIIH